MAKQDYYELLGVAKDASERDIRKAYKKQAMKYHPDRNKGDKKSEVKFKEVSEAYEVLSDGSKRSAYDQFGHAGVDNSQGGFSGQGADFSDIFGDVFGDIFGQRQGRSRQRGADLQYNMELSLEEAVKGISKNIEIPTQVKCDSCDGSGAKPGTSAKTCSSCHGQGQVQMRQGFFSVSQTCPTCRGQGSVIESPCTKCRGQGRYEKSKTLAIKIPPGVATGDRIRLSGEGQAGATGGDSGDLYVQMHVKDHHIFARDGNNLHCEIPISFTSAALGGDVEVPTLDKKVKLKIPKETQTGHMFRIRGRGVKSIRNGSVGDLICKVILETPVNLNQKQEDILIEFENSISSSKENAHRPKEKGFFKGVKKFFEDLR